MSHTPTLPYEKRRIEVTPFKGVTNYKKLSKADRDELWRDALGDDLTLKEKAQKILIELNLPLLLSIVQKSHARMAEMPWHGLAADDLIGEGYIGLKRAVEKFEPSRGLQFSSYATQWVWRVLGRSLGDNDNLIRIPENVRNNAPDGVVLPKAYSIEQEDEFLNSTLSATGGLPDSVADRGFLCREPVEVSEQNVEEEGIHAVECIEIRRLVSLLAPRQREIITLRYGLDGPEQTLEQVSKAIGISRERVRQIETAALQKLRAMMEESQ